MIISTRGRYALRVMIDLSQQDPDSYTPLKEIAARQEISEKYLENILKSLVTQGFILGLRGKGGGYRLTKSPEEYTLASILHAAGNIPELVDRCGQAQGGALRHGGCRRRQHRARRPVHHRVPVGPGGCCPGDGDKRGPWRCDSVPLFRAAELEHVAPGSPAYRRAGFGACLRERLVGACLEPFHVARVYGLQLPADGLYRS